NESQEGSIENTQIQRRTLQERKSHDRRETSLAGPLLDRPGDRQRDEKLRQELSSPGQTEAPTPGQLHIVVGKTDRAQRDECRQSDPDEPVGGIHPQNRRGEHREKDQQSSHGRRAGLGEMGLGPFLSNRLSDLTAL